MPHPLFSWFFTMITSPTQQLSSLSFLAAKSYNIRAFWIPTGAPLLLGSAMFQKKRVEFQRVCPTCSSTLQPFFNHFFLKREKKECIENRRRVRCDPKMCSGATCTALG